MGEQKVLFLWNAGKHSPRVEQNAPAFGLLLSSEPVSVPGNRYN